LAERFGGQEHPADSPLQNLHFARPAIAPAFAVAEPGVVGRTRVYPMNRSVPVRLLWLLWLAALVLFIGVALFPVSNSATRAGGVALIFVFWFGLIGLSWRRRAVRFSLIGITFLSAGFLALPAHHLPDPRLLRRDYVDGLNRYDDVTYYWGGESPKGIDCSGLIRRGLIDSLFCRGIRSLDPGLVRCAISLWWHDTTASELGQQHKELTVHRFDASSVNAVDQRQVLPGDLAVVGNGIHIMAYLGSNVWIEADPDVGRVIRVTTPSPDNHWFQTPTKIVRWTVLQ
jgi:hypothetical protein